MKYLITVIMGALAGFFARWYMLRRDYRQYPSYPQGWAIHLFLGFIGGLIGAVIVPSFLEQEFAAVSFLLLAASQFREVRNAERNTLAAVESTEMVSRGNAYIEGIARVFEARNYLAIWVSLAVAITSELLAQFLFPVRIIGGLLVACGSAFVLNRLMQGDYVGDIAQVRLADLSFEGPILVVDGVKMMNVGLAQARQVYEERGLAAVIAPNGPNTKATLANLGQMQAIAHDVSAMIGIYMDVGEQEFTPLVRREPSTGKLVFVMIPSAQDPEAFIAAIKRVPVLEGAVRKPLTSKPGRMMD
jgi:uncharacterized membrane protein YeaQ/YmgE (transglycosylase-associated protein family)